MVQGVVVTGSRMAETLRDGVGLEGAGGKTVKTMSAINTTPVFSTHCNCESIKSIELWNVLHAIIILKSHVEHVALHVHC